MAVNSDQLRIELAKLGWTKIRLARAMRVPPTTLSGWLREVNPAPADLDARIEKALGLTPGTLKAAEERTDAPSRAAETTPVHSA